MKKISFLSLFLTLALCAGAQTYSISNLTLGQFCGDAAPFGFAKYTVGQGYSAFTQCGDSSTCNYVDVHQVEYAGGRIICEIDGVVNAGENTWASNIRTAWFDQSFKDVRTDSKGKFVYVAFDPREGYGLEMNGNDEQTAAITFTAPADGWYQFSGSVIRQDINTGFGTLALQPTFRYATAPEERLEFGNPIRYTSTCGEIEGFEGNSNLDAGGHRRYVAQEPTEFTFAVQAQAGDVVTLELNVAGTGMSSGWARDYQSRSFLQKLNVEIVDEDAAAEAGFCVDPYGPIDEDNIFAVADSLTGVASDLEIGDEYGQCPKEAYDAFMAAVEAFWQAYDDEVINVLNADSYLQVLRTAFNKMMASCIMYDLNCEGNYVLVNSVDGAINYVDDDAMSYNGDQPWGYAYHDLGTGAYVKFAGHDTNNKSGVSAWYKGSGDWLYVTDSLSIHPTATQAPAIMFTAPEDGVYRVMYTCSRPNPNPSVVNTMYLRSYFLKSGTESVAKTNDIFSTPYGNVSEDGEGGKALVSGDFFVNMKAGDRVISEEDCWTVNRNSSAGTQFWQYIVLSRLNEEEAYTAKYANESGIFFYNPYEAGNPAVLQAALDAANAAIAAVGEANIGDESGKYDFAVYVQLNDLMMTAEGAIVAATNGDSTWDQLALNALAQQLTDKTAEFADSRLPFEKIIEGTWSIQLTGTNKFLTQKNQGEADYHYAGFLTAEVVWADDAQTEVSSYPAGSIGADIEKNGMQWEAYDWTFTFSADTVSGGTQIRNANGYLCGDGYVVRVAPEEPAGTGFRFWTKEKDDEAFAIQRLSDGKYLGGAFTWKSPHDMISIYDKPQYLFNLSENTITAIEEAVAEQPTLADTRYYSLDGRQVSGADKGIVIRVSTYTDGTVQVEKRLVK